MYFFIFKYLTIKFHSSVVFNPDMNYLKGVLSIHVFSETHLSIIFNDISLVFMGKQTFISPSAFFKPIF